MLSLVTSKHPDIITKAAWRWRYAMHFVCAITKWSSSNVMRQTNSNVDVFKKLCAWVDSMIVWLSMVRNDSGYVCIRGALTKRCQDNKSKVSPYSPNKKEMNITSDMFLHEVTCPLLKIRVSSKCSSHDRKRFAILAFLVVDPHPPPIWNTREWMKPHRPNIVQNLLVASTKLSRKILVAKVCPVPTSRKILPSCHYAARLTRAANEFVSYHSS